MTVMPRGRKPNKSIEERIELIDKEISKYENKVKELKSRKAEFLEIKEKEKLKDLYALLEERNLSIDQLASLINNTENA